MKKISFLKHSAFVFGLAIALASCDSTPKGDKAEISARETAVDAEGQEFKVDTVKSYIRFTGNGVGKNHPGKFRLASGNVTVANGQLAGGDFVIDINSMLLEEEGEMFQNKLRPHLMSGDFFNAEKFSTAEFQITKVAPYRSDGKDTSMVEGANFYLSGNLKLKETTKNITFPARVDLDENTMRGRANFDIDRREWMINYGNDKTLGDKFISETVNIELDLYANKR